MNDLDYIEGADIENTCLTAPCREKEWIKGGAFYGLKSSGTAFRAFLAEANDQKGFKSSIANPDAWMRPASKPDGEHHYEYLICYVDDVLGISLEAKGLLKELQAEFKFKKDKIEPPNIYLGGKLAQKV